MKKISSSIVGGITGAVALNILHQVAKQFDHEAPRVDLVGEEALSAGLEKMHIAPPAGDRLFAATLVADLISNAAYYSAIGYAKGNALPVAGLAAGLTAGIGAVGLTGPLGLNDAPVTRSQKTKLLTIAWYTFGGLVAGSVMLALRKKS